MHIIYIYSGCNADFTRLKIQEKKLNKMKNNLICYYVSIAQCPMLTAPENGMISCAGTGGDVGDTCTISCDDGYDLSGSETRTCQDDGSWSGTDAVCAIGTVSYVYRNYFKLLL